MTLKFNERLKVNPEVYSGTVWGIRFELYHYTNTFERSDGRMGRNPGPDPVIIQAGLSWGPRDIAAFNKLPFCAKWVQFWRVHDFLSRKIAEHLAAMEIV